MISAGDALSALKALYDIANKVKNNKDELLRLLRKIEHIVVTIEKCRDRDDIRSDEYNDALTAIADWITRAQRTAQKELKRSLADRTWNASEISLELRRLNDDIQIYLSVHQIRVIDLLHTSAHENRVVIVVTTPEEVMVKLAELGLYLRPRPGDEWAPSIESQARSNFAKSINEQRNSAAQPTSALLSASPRGARVFRAAGDANEMLDGVDFEALKLSGKIALKVTGLRSRDFNDKTLTSRDLRLQADASRDEILHAIKDAGFRTPDRLYEEQNLSICVTEGDSVYDAFFPGGLKVNQSEPLLWWWNKYTTYHGLAPATTPGHTIARLEHEYGTRRVTGVNVAGVLFHFHRTLRTPDSRTSDLPKGLDRFPLVPVNRFLRGVPPALRDRGGFMMPMFRREAVCIQFAATGSVSGQAVKVSVGGVNALSGISTTSIEPPKFGAEQDYIVVGQQHWLDGIVSGPGVIRQFVTTGLGSGYTVEEQVTGKAEIGGFQFDIFPRRPSVDGKFFSHAGKELNSVNSPSELQLAEGDQLIVERPLESADIRWPRNEWSLANYKRRISLGARIKAYYSDQGVDTFAGPRVVKGYSNINTGRNYGLLGVASGGEIEQKIYRDIDSPRVYDEERGHRFHVHIVTPELWETITGVLPPITPITRDMYIQNGLNWYKIFDDYVDSITTTSETLSNILSVTQLDEKNLALSDENQAGNLIDPDAPQGCSRHPNETSSCVFRPCNHLACVKCVGLATLGGSRCPKCQVVVKIVRMQTTLSDLFQKKGSTYEEGQWAGEDTVVVIHQPEDRPSPLYSSNQPKLMGGRRWFD